MQDKLPTPLRPQYFNMLLWLAGVILLLATKGIIERTFGSTRDSALDLTLVLIAYLLLFLLDPIRARINRRLRKRARRLNTRHSPKTRL